MTNKLRVYVIILSAIFIIYLINMIRKNKINLKYILSWISISTGILIIALFPSILNLFSNFLGVKDPMNALYFLGFIFLIIVVFSLTVAQSRLSDKVKSLSQEIALNNYEKKINNKSRDEI
ncbi:DUF2304 domain-containing protein [Peptoanaerobacter stomatis]|uniref:DUF2304 domain-containing protein n=1 Tax=Peptoanaerobacter stomatis TaxID=796937 RepID=UPI003FA085DE